MVPQPLQLIGCALAATGMSAAVVPIVRIWAKRKGILDVPNERSSHSEPTPRGGGLAIVCAVALGTAVCVVVGLMGLTLALALSSIGALLVASVSWIEDLRGVPIGWRLAAHSGAAALVMVGLAEGDVLVGGPEGTPWAVLILAAGMFIWVAGLTNAFNFMDGIDGIAASEGAIAGAAWAVFGWHAASSVAALLGALICGACLGFLFFNWSPAKVFMGDVGSAFLGFSLAVLPLLVTRFGLRLSVAGSLVVWPFVFDTGFTLARRLARREDVLRSHRSHLYQRLVIAGWSHRAVTLLYSGLSMASVLAGWGWLAAGGATLYVAFGLPVVGAALLLGLVLLAERRSGVGRTAIAR
jgi:glycosyltransferase WbpL